MTTKTQSLLELLNSARVYDLAQPYFVGMPHHPVHPPFLFSLTKMHGDYVMPNGGSSASEGLALGGHLGTHIDALCHFSCGGKLHGGHDVAASQSYSGGMTQLSVDTLSPIVRRGVLLDIAGQQKVASLPRHLRSRPNTWRPPRAPKPSKSSPAMSSSCAQGGAHSLKMSRGLSRRCTAPGQPSRERAG